MFIFVVSFRRYVTEFPQYNNMMPWFIAKNVYVVCSEPKVKEVLKLVKKIPELIVLGKGRKLYSRLCENWIN